MLLRYGPGAAADQLGYVPQKGVLFSGTIDSNLKFGGEHITDADVRGAAEIAQAAEFISAKPEGYNTPIAQGGSNVPAGRNSGCPSPARLPSTRGFTCLTTVSRRWTTKPTWRCVVR